MTPHHSSRQVHAPSRPTKTPQRRSRRVISLEGAAMQSPASVVQLVTRIPYDLRHRAKVHCVEHDTTLTQFVIDAIRERLTVKERSPSARRTSR